MILPAWVEDSSHATWEQRDQFRKALNIAWEALDMISECDAEVCPESEGRYKAKEALRRIEELGK